MLGGPSSLLALRGITAKNNSGPLQAIIASEIGMCRGYLVNKTLLVAILSDRMRG